MAISMTETTMESGSVVIRLDGIRSVRLGLSGIGKLLVLIFIVALLAIYALNAGWIWAIGVIFVFVIAFVKGPCHSLIANTGGKDVTLTGDWEEVLEAKQILNEAVRRGASIHTP